MKKSYLISLSLAAVLSVPALAQQNQTPADQPQNQTTQAQPAQTQPAQTQSQPAAEQVATGKAPLKYERHEGFWGKVNPFARKKYVNRQLDPVRGRVNELTSSRPRTAKTSPTWTRGPMKASATPWAKPMKPTPTP